MKHIEAQDIVWMNTVRFDGETYHVINSTFDTEQEKVLLWLSPTDGFGPDKFIGVPPKFNFELIETPITL